jgi:site-specific recombinase XerD
MYRGGLRVSEALALQGADLDPDAGTVNIRRGKGSKQRIVALDPAAFALVERWREERRRLGLNGKALLFCAHSKGSAGKPLAPRYVGAMLRRMAARAGVEKRTHPHGLRHAFAHELAMEGTPLPVVSKLLGHGAASTTSAYLDSLGAPDAIAAVRGRRWKEAEGRGGAKKDTIAGLRAQLAEIAARLEEMEGGR